MAIIKCPECGKEISDKAKQCPSCGYPIEATTIEATSKIWKCLQLLGGIIFCVGVVMIFSNPGGDTGIITTAVGLLLHFVGRVGAWWYHG